MSERHSSVVRSASTQLSKSSTSTFLEEPTYAVQIDEDKINHVLPILMPKLLEVISNTCFNSEVKQNIYRDGGLEEISDGQDVGTRNEVSRSNSNGSDTSTSLLLPEDNNGQQVPALHSSNNGTIYYKQGGQVREEEIVKDNSILSWVTFTRLSCAISLIAITFVVTLAGISIVWQVWFRVDTENTIAFRNVFSPFNSNDDAYEVVINSFDEYKSLVERKDVGHMKLVINIDRPGDWPLGVSIPNTKYLKSLNVKGSLHGKKFIELLASISFIERLTIDNEDNSICSETQQMVGTINTRFKTQTSITTLELTRVTASCKELFECMHENIQFNKLEKVIFTNGELSETNVGPFEKILLQYKQSLHHIEILGTSTNATLFRQHNFQFLNKVKRLALDIYGADSAISKTLLNICTMLPTLESLSLGKLLHKWEDIPKLFGCHRLKTFQFSMVLPKSNDKFNLDFLPDVFPYLQSADIVIIFGDSLDDKRCDESKIIFGPKKLSDGLLVNTRITSNCDLVFL